LFVANVTLYAIAGRRLAVLEAFSAAAAALVQHDDRLVDELVFRDDRLNRTREIVGPAAGSGRDDELDRLRRLPVGGIGRCNRQRERADDDRYRMNLPCV
jgi:hypothetical protein